MIVLFVTDARQENNYIKNKILNFFEIATNFIESGIKALEKLHWYNTNI